MAADTSPGSPKRPMSIGSFSIMRAMTSSGETPRRSDATAVLASTPSVIVMPGSTRSSSTPSAANAIDRFREKLTSAALAAEYGTEQRIGLACERRRDVDDPSPACACMMGTHASASRTAEKKFCSNPCCHSSSAER